MAYSVEIAPAATRQFKKLPRPAQEDSRKAIWGLANEPMPPGVDRVTGVDACYRIRCGDYRILYLVDSGEKRIIVIRIGDRREVYKDVVADLKKQAKVRLRRGER